MMSTFSKKIAIAAIITVAGTMGLSAGLAPGYVGMPSVSAATAYETTIISGVNLRASASTNGRIITMLSRGQNVRVVSQVNSYWLKVQTTSGLTGYISADAKFSNYQSSVTSTSASSSNRADTVVRLAESYIGKVRYSYGTRDTSRLIFDCSSFTQYIYGKAGVNLKWGTKDQRYQGAAVSRSSLRKGDLIFFDTVGVNDRKINHVGIYMGGGRFIHNTPSKNGVTIDSLNSGWWKDRYVSARRVL